MSVKQRARDRAGEVRLEGETQPREQDGPWETDWLYAGDSSGCPQWSAQTWEDSLSGNENPMPRADSAVKVSMARREGRDFFQTPAHSQTRWLWSLSRVTSLDFFLNSGALSQEITLLPSPHSSSGSSCSSESLNGDHVSCHLNVWSEPAFEDCHNDLCWLLPCAFIWNPWLSVCFPKCLQIQSWWVLSACSDQHQALQFTFTLDIQKWNGTHQDTGTHVSLLPSDFCLFLSFSLFTPPFFILIHIYVITIKTLILSAWFHSYSHYGKSGKNN